MRRTIALAALSVSLLGGVASADRYRGREVRHEPRREVVVEHRAPGREVVVERRGPVREEIRYRDHYRRPEYRVESFAPVTGYSWHRGDWVWNGNEWIWQAGWYVRL